MKITLRNPSHVATSFGLAIVRKSVDPAFKQWACIYPNSKTRWFKTEQAAEQAKRDFNEGKCATMGF